MNPFFSCLSAVYIFGIFYWADSPAVSQLQVFNPLSLLHIPLYGGLTLILVLALGNGEKRNLKNRYAAAVLVAATVAVLDEFHQSFIPSREASITDVFLDLVGIILVIFLFRKVPWFFWSAIFKKVGIHIPSEKEGDIKFRKEHI